MKLTVGQAVVQFLKQQYLSVDGVEDRFVAGITGIFGHGNVVGLGQALQQYRNEFPYVQCKNEQDAGHVAMGFAKQNRRRKIMGVTASIGPGSLNMVTAAGTATVNKIPVLFLPSDSYADRQPDPALQQVECEHDYTVSVNDAFKPVSTYWDKVQRPKQLMKALLNAMNTLTDPARAGAAVICLPQDVQGESYDYPDSFFEKRVWYLDRRVPTADAIARAVEIMRTAKHPFIVSGGGTRYSDAGAELQKFCNEFNISFGETQAGKGEVSFDDPHNMGCAGICGTQAANRIAKQADVVIHLGTKLNDFVTCSKDSLRPDVKVISINVRTMDAIKYNALSVIADAREGLKALGDALRQVNYKSAYTDEYDKAKADWLAELDRLGKLAPAEGLSQTRVLLELNKAMQPSDIIVAASGSMPSDVERLWKVPQQGGYHLEYGFSCMGYEVGAALGVKMAEPEREVYALFGDGVFFMSHSEFITSLQERKKINLIVFDNHGHQCIHNLQRSQGIESFATEFRYREDDSNCLTGEYVPVSFAKIAEGYGAKSYTCTTLEQVLAALEDSRKQTASTLIEIKVLPGTMTESYDAFWRVGTASVSESEKVHQAWEKMDAKVKTLPRY